MADINPIRNALCISDPMQSIQSCRPYYLHVITHSITRGGGWSIFEINLFRLFFHEINNV